MVFDAFYQAMAPNEPQPMHCDFGGAAYLQYPGETTKPPTEEPTNGPTNEPPEDKEVCRANPEASNADLCGSMEWACYGHNYVDMKVEKVI